MRKINFLRTVLCVAGAMLVTATTFGQIPGDYEVYDPAAPAPDNIDYVTVGKTMGYYTLPDPVYHPDYTTDGTLTVGFSWDWVNTVNPGTAATVTEAVGVANYATILFPVIGPYTFTATETAPVAFGGCAGSSRTINVTAINAPTAAFSTADVLTGLCGAQPAAAINLAITENIPDALAGYAFTITETIDNIDAADALIANVSTNATFVNFPLNGKVKDGTPGFTSASPDFDFDFNSSALNVATNLRTRYTYTLTSAAGVTGTGIVSAISHKSDYLTPASVTGYAFGAKTTVVFIVNPAPVTGPIYHVPNDFNY